MKKSDVKMEDINRLMVALYDQMDKDNLELSREEENKFDRKLMITLEEFFNYPDYRNYN